MTKQFKLGEYAVGGIIKLEKKSDSITVSALDYSSKRQLQSQTFSLDDLSRIDWYIGDLTTSYYTDKIMNHIKTKML
jgi:hypothetical protein